MSSNENDTQAALFAGHSTVRILLIVAAVLAVFVASYAYASAQSASAASASPSGDPYGTAVPASTAGGEEGCSCCGGSGEEIAGETTVDGDVQRIDVGIGAGYEPNIVYAKAGIPIEMTFAQGSGCFAEIYFPGFDIFEDLTAGPKTITLPALDAGQYGWSCGMQMVYGAIIVE